MVFQFCISFVHSRDEAVKTDAAHVTVKGCGLFLVSSRGSVYVWSHFRNGGRLTGVSSNQKPSTEPVDVTDGSYVSPMKEKKKKKEKKKLADYSDPASKYLSVVAWVLLQRNEESDVPGSS
ncbi:unnamed protein product [Pleuronectes platessa]|uniref:Uncharacterized protein n=1 Tax=Pleuronectes platessa TaxID=8262 RepID=A0A9N7Z011_PLEPL|nr:unnamed protein product [Pleuronectes platessa]